jgi:hypothetical protein
MNDQFDEYIHDEQGPADWKIPLLWSALLVIGFVLLEVTARPQWGLAFVCLKFGWSYFRSAFWLLRVDPDRYRAWACFWLYLGAGLFKASVIALMAMFVLGMVEAFSVPANLQGQRAFLQNDPFFEVFLLLLTAFVGFGLSALSTLAAIGLGRRHGIRFWLDARIDRARRNKAWPPFRSSLVYSSVLGKNWASRLIFAAFAIITYIFVLGVLIVVFLAPLNNQPIGELIMIASLISLFITMYGGLLILYFVFRVERISFPRLVATTPWECWSSANLDLAQS